MAEIGTDIKKAATILNVGGLVAIPTDTVYGLAANALDERAVEEIYRVKRRPKDKPLAIQISNIDQLEEYCKVVPEKAYQLAEKFWPGPLTLVFEKSEKIPAIVTSGLNTIGVRVPEHPITLELLKLLDYPLAVPSANISGLPSATNTIQVNQHLSEISYILEGGTCSVGVESTIVAVHDEDFKILREGAIKKEIIFNAIG